MKIKIIEIFEIIFMLYFKSSELITTLTLLKIIASQANSGFKIIQKL